MRDRSDREASVTYVGPRSFIVAFTLVCGALLAVLYGTGQVTSGQETGDLPAPGVAPVKLRVAATNASPAPLASLPAGAQSALPKPRASSAAPEPIPSAAATPAIQALIGWNARLGPAPQRREPAARPRNMQPSPATLAAVPRAHPALFVAPNTILGISPVAAVRGPTATRSVPRRERASAPVHLANSIHITTPRPEQTPLLPVAPARPPTSIIIPFRAGSATSPDALTPQPGSAALMIEPQPAVSVAPVIRPVDH